MKTQIDKELGQQCIEAFRRSGYPARRAATNAACRTASAKQSESAANGGIVNLQENRAMNSNTQHPITHDRMVEAFRGIGLGEEAAKSAAQGRDDGYRPFGETISPALREALNHPVNDGNEVRGQVVVHHQTEADIREATRLADIREAERKVEADRRTRMTEAFVDMGFSPEAAAIAARGRGR